MEINSHPFDRSGSKNVLFHQALRSWRTEYQIKWVGSTVLKHVKKYLGIPVVTTYFFWCVWVSQSVFHQFGGDFPLIFFGPRKMIIDLDN